MRRFLPIAAVALGLAVPAGAAARNHDLWVTINLCDTPQHPDKLGVRGRMPGNDTRDRMYMRFTAQYRAADGTWQPIRGKNESPWIYAGSALFSHEETGFTFSIDPPKAGERFVLRGTADFQWRAKRRKNGRVRIVVVKEARLHTEAGHPSTGAEPAGYSSASCVIEGPAS
jgi:hypothetical protein